MRNTKFYLFFFVLGIIMFSCKDKDKDKDKVEFNKTEIMVNLADGWVYPAYQEVSSKIDSLISKWSLFKANSNQTNLENCQNSWKEAYLSFQKIKFIDFGPAMNVAYQGSLGTFPVDTVNIEENIAAGTYDLATVDNISSIGFPSLDYLFFRNGALNQLMNESARRAYVDAVLSKMKSDADYVVSNWSNYRNTFVEGVGTSSTDPFSQLVNAFCKDYELAKTAKIGIPLGKQSLGIQRLEYLEARYSKFGKELLVENLKSLKAVFEGKNGKGFDDYLTALEKQSLASTISSRFDYMISQAEGWNTDMHDLFVNQTPAAEAYYDYVQGTVVYIKTDMTSAFGILITYQDNDGD